MMMVMMNDLFIYPFIYHHVSKWVTSDTGAHNFNLAKSVIVDKDICGRASYTHLLGVVCGDVFYVHWAYDYLGPFGVLWVHSGTWLDTKIVLKKMQINFNKNCLNFLFYALRTCDFLFYAIGCALCNKARYLNKIRKDKNAENRNW